MRVLGADKGRRATLVAVVSLAAIAFSAVPAGAELDGIRNPYDPASNIEAGVKHLRSLLERFPLALDLATCNAGEAAVHRFSGIPPYPETRFYIRRLLKLTGR
jgi:soluble lytic murein transglycosylase-like protein